jgi:TRAP transporter TAXI family solute receptor
MKKYGIIVALLLSILLLLTACGQNNGAATNNETPTEGQSVEKFTIYLAGATPGGGGVWDMIGAGLSEAIVRSNKGSSVTVIPGGGVSDVPVVSQEEAELGLTHSVIAVAGIKGIDPFKESYTNIKGVVSLYPSQLQFMVNPKLGIEKISDIKDKKISIQIAVGDPGSTGELATKRMLEAYGISYADIESWGGKVLFKDMGEAASMYGDDIINAFTLLTLAPNGPLQQVATNKAISMLPIDAEVIQKMVDNYGYSEAIVPQTAYEFLKEDLPSFSSQVVLITNDECSEEVIYQVTKGFVENLDYIRSIHNNLKDLTEENMTLTSVELHPGAVKYYKEIGVL